MFMAQQGEEDFMTTGEAARVLELSNQHVHRLVTTGKLPVAGRAGKGLLLFRRSEVAALKEERRRNPPKPGPKTDPRPQNVVELQRQVEAEKTPKKKAAKVTKKTTTEKKGRAKTP